MFPGITVFGKFISSYTLAALVGALSAGLFAIFTAKKRTGDGYPMLATLLWSCVGVFFGGSIVYAFTNIESWHLLFEAESFEQWWDCVLAIFGGSVFYGGLLGGMAVGIFVMKRRGYPALLMSDILACAVALFHGFGRIGCFLGGCCYGIESEWGFKFTHGLIASANGVTRIPVQLFESAFEFALFFVLLQLLRRGKLEGRLFAVYLVCYGVFRFFNEFLRGDTYRGFILGLSTSQFISIFVVLGAAIWLVLHRSGTERKTQ